MVKYSSLAGLRATTCQTIWWTKLRFVGKTNCTEETNGFLTVIHINISINLFILMMDRDVAGIRISPSSVEFYDTVPDTVEQLNVTVYNISKGSKSIRFYAPKTKVCSFYKKLA